MLLQSLFYYVWKEGVKNEDTGKIEHNIGAVLKLLTLAEFTEDRNGNKQPSELDHLMDELAKRILSILRYSTTTKSCVVLLIL